MQSNINDIQFGNMSQECFYWAEQHCYLDKLFSSVTAFTFPANSSKTTKDELNQVKKAVEDISDVSQKNILDTYIEFDRKQYTIFKGIIEVSAIENGDDIKKVIDDVVADVAPLIYKLKHYYQRPRPFQLAGAYKLLLHPFITVSQGSCASYPSATVIFSRVLAHVVGNRIPGLYRNMQLLQDDITASRVPLGANYQSDVDAAIYIADMILQEQEFKLKYKL